MKFNKVNYPDGSFYTQITDLSSDLMFRINSYDDLWQLRQIKDICDSQGVSVSLSIPCLFDAQADRRFNFNESSNLKLVCQFINDMKFSRVSVFHPHNSEVVEALLDNCAIIDNSEFIRKVFSQIKTESFSQDTILLSTDGGGFKPLMKLVDNIKWKGEIYGASKSRKYEGGESKLVQVIDRQDFEGKDILIIDDMCLFGGTFIGLAKMLKERNCGKLYLAVSHITVPNPNPELFNLFDKVFCTNSKYDEYFPIPHKDGGGSSKAENLEVIKLF